MPQQQLTVTMATSYPDWWMDFQRFLLVLSFTFKVIIWCCRTVCVNLMNPFLELCSGSPHDPPLGTWLVSPGSGSAARGLKRLRGVTFAGGVISWARRRSESLAAWNVSRVTAHVCPLDSKQQVLNSVLSCSQWWDEGLLLSFHLRMPSVWPQRLWRYSNPDFLVNLSDLLDLKRFPDKKKKNKKKVEYSGGVLSPMLLFKGLRCSDSSHERCYLTGGRVLFFMVDSETSQPPSAASPEGSGWRGARSPLPDFVPGINRM